MDNRDDFTPDVKNTVARRACYICSNPDCKKSTLKPSEDKNKYIYVGRVCHMSAAAPGGARYNSNFNKAQRSSIDNAIYLCPTCADMIDKNNGGDFPIEILKKWKEEHESKMVENFGKSKKFTLTEMNGEHIARGRGKIIGLDLKGPHLIKPGTKSVAEGEGEIIATKSEN